MKQKSNIQIKNTEHYEIPYIAEMEKRCFSVCAWTENMFKNVFESADNNIMLTAYCDDKLAGYIVVSFCIDEAEIMVVAVDEPFRQRGVAQALLDSAETALNGRAEKIFLEVRESNTPAQKLYEKNNFVVTGFRKNYYSDFSGQKPEDAILMTKYLRNSEMIL